MANPLDPYPGIPLKHPNSGREFSDGERKILYDRQQQRLSAGGGRHRDPLAPPVEPEPAPARADDTVTFAPVDDEEGGLDELWDREERRRTTGATPTRGPGRAVQAWDKATAPRERRPRPLGAARWRPPIWLALVGVVVGFVFGALLATMGIMADPTILPGDPAPVPTVTFVPPVEMPAP